MSAKAALSSRRNAAFAPHSCQPSTPRLDPDWADLNVDRHIPDQPTAEDDALILLHREQLLLEKGAHPGQQLFSISIRLIGKIDAR
jgi:hypothetical protein